MDPLKIVEFKTAHLPRSYVNSLVRFQPHYTVEDRLNAAMMSGWNVFQFPAEMVMCGDLLSDSGTTTITAEQLAALMLGDEAYGSNNGYYLLLDTFAEIFGIPKEESEVFLFHQGRASEHALFTAVSKWGKEMIIPSNGHFDTTFANIEINGIQPVNLFCSHLYEDAYYPFKGNMDVEALEQLLSQHHEKIPLVYCTITNNTAGGQPVSMSNLQAIRTICDRYHKPFFLDACRFAENAWFIKEREEKYRNDSVGNIVKAIFALCDAFTISFKKDGLANMGGALIVKQQASFLKEHPTLLNDLRDFQILVEGHPTYGGISGRDIMVIATGLTQVIQENYLESRIGLVHAFGEYMHKSGVPVLTPFGGHAVYIDMNKFLADTTHRPEDFGGIALTALLLLKGVRLCELGNFAFGVYDPAMQIEKFPRHNFVRCAVPRNRYELQDLYYVADCVSQLYQKRDELPRAVPIFGRELALRHFKARFELMPS